LSYSDFTADLQDGSKYEDALVAFLKGQGHSTARALHIYTKDYDVVCDCGLSYEVKHDRQSGNTGNVAIETECRGKASGLTATKALFYVWYLKDEIIFVATDAMHGLIEGRRPIMGGEQKASKLFLVPVSRLRKAACYRAAA
jgi:hypothetical protein